MTTVILILMIVQLLYMSLALILAYKQQKANLRMFAELVDRGGMVLSKANLALGKYNRHMAFVEAKRHIRRNDEDIARYERINAEYAQRLEEEREKPWEN